MPERPQTNGIVSSQPFEELTGTFAEQLQIALHAARHVEQHDEANGLRRIVEERDRLRLAFVANLEVFLLERRDEPPVAIHDRGENADVISSTAEGRLLLRGGAEADREAGSEDSGGENPNHT